MNFKSENTAFAAAVSDKALGEGFDRKDPSSRSNVVEREAFLNLRSGTFSSLLCILALSSVLGRDILTVYPEEEQNTSMYSLTNNGLIHPRKYHDLCHQIKFPSYGIVIMWTTTGNFTLESRCDHFVPLIPPSSNMQRKGVACISHKVNQPTIQNMFQNLKSAVNRGEYNKFLLTLKTETSKFHLYQ